MSLTAEHSHTPEDFIRRDWTDLEAADPAGSFFQTPAFLKLYWEEFGDELDLSLLFVREADDAGAVDATGSTVAAGAFERIGTTLRFLGGTEITDYMGPVSVDVLRPAAASAMLDELAKDGAWSLADLIGLPEGSPWIDALVEAAAAQGFWHQVDEYDVTPRLELPETWDAYLEWLPTKLRHELKRKARKLDAETGGYRIVFADADTLETDLDRFVALHRTSEGPKGKFMVPGMEIFFRRIGEAFLPEGTFRLAFVEIDGVKVAGAIGFVHHGVFNLYNSALDSEWRQLSPGMVLVGELIKASIEEGLHTFDMLKGGLEYKFRFGSVARPLMRLQLRRP